MTSNEPVKDQWFGRIGHCCDMEGDLLHEPGTCCHGQCCGVGDIPPAAAATERAGAS